MRFFWGEKTQLSKSKLDFSLFLIEKGKNLRKKALISTAVGEFFENFLSHPVQFRDLGFDAITLAAFNVGVDDVEFGAKSGETRFARTPNGRFVVAGQVKPGKTKLNQMENLENRPVKCGILEANSRFCEFR